MIAVWSPDFRRKFGPNFDVQVAYIGEDVKGATRIVRVINIRLVWWRKWMNNDVGSVTRRKGAC